MRLTRKHKARIAATTAWILVVTFIEVLNVTVLSGFEATFYLLDGMIFGVVGVILAMLVYDEVRYP